MKLRPNFGCFYDYGLIFQICAHKKLAVFVLLSLFSENKAVLCAGLLVFLECFNLSPS